MNINELIAIVKKKIESEIVVENIFIEDKSFLHKKHSGNDIDRYHLKIQIKSIELKKISKVDGTKKIYKILDSEIKNFIHSLQLLIN